MINPFDFFKVKAGLGKLGEEHPKLFPFMKAVSAAGAREGTIVEMKVTTPEGQVLESNMKLTANDIELFRMIREIGGAAMSNQGAPTAPAEGAGDQDAPADSADDLGNQSASTAPSDGLGNQRATVALSDGIGNQGATADFEKGSGNQGAATGQDSDNVIEE